MKNNYEKPELDVMDFAVEQGFAATGEEVEGGGENMEGGW